MGGRGSQCDVSVVMPAYNCEATIEQSIRSTLDQSLHAIEVIVVDDGSTDRTMDIVQEFVTRDRRVIAISLPQNLGVAAARNVALERASGEWIAIVDADDWMLPDRLRDMHANAQRLNADLVCDNLLLFDHALGRVVGKTRFGARNRPTLMNAQMIFEHELAYTRHHLGFTKPMVRTAFVRDKAITYDPSYRVGEDLLFLAEIILNGARAYILPSAAYIYVHRVSPSTRTVAPNSRAATGFADITRSCRQILTKYGRTMSKRERRALAQKRKSISDWLLYMDMLAAIRARDFRSAFAILRRRPALIGIKIHTSHNRLRDLAMISWSQLWQSRDGSGRTHGCGPYAGQLSSRK